MSEALVISILTAIASLATLIVSIIGMRKVEQVHKATNSMHDAMVALTNKEAHARGLAEGRAEGLP